MILCVTLNPCLDKTLTVAPWRPGDLVRGTAVRQVVGGKGNNVARALRRLGRKPRPVTFLGGSVGDLCERLLKSDDRLDPIVVPSEAPTREILTVRTDTSSDQTAFFDPDPAVSPQEAESLASRVVAVLDQGGGSALCLSGSSPSPATHGLYSDLIALARARDVPVFLDTYGPALAAIWGFWPTAIQLNRREACLYLRKPTASDLDIAALLAAWSINFRGKPYRAIPPAITALNPIGSGDCLLAGLVDGWLSRLDFEPLLRHAIACAVANALVWDAGAIVPDEVARLSDHVVVEPVSR
jgi:tagatose 6-phosphate kinase